MADTMFMYNYFPPKGRQGSWCHLIVKVKVCDPTREKLLRLQHHFVYPQLSQVAALLQCALIFHQMTSLSGNLLRVVSLLYVATSHAVLFQIIAEKCAKFLLHDLAMLANRVLCNSQRKALMNRSPVMTTPIGLGRILHKEIELLKPLLLFVSKECMKYVLPTLIFFCARKIEQNLPPLKKMGQGITLTSYSDTRLSTDLCIHGWLYEIKRLSRLGNLHPYANQVHAVIFQQHISMFEIFRNSSWAG